MIELKNEVQHVRVIINKLFDEKGNERPFKEYLVVTDDKGHLQKVAWRRNVNLQVFEGMHKVEFDCKYYKPEKYVEYPRVWIGDIVLDSIKKIS